MKHKIPTAVTAADVVALTSNNAWMSIEELCLVLGEARSTIARWRADGRAPAGKRLPNGKVKFRRDEIAAWLINLDAAA